MSTSSSSSTSHHHPDVSTHPTVVKEWLSWEDEVKLRLKKLPAVRPFHSQLTAACSYILRPVGMPGPQEQCDWEEAPWDLSHQAAVLPK